MLTCLVNFPERESTAIAKDAIPPISRLVLGIDFRVQLG